MWLPRTSTSTAGNAASTSLMHRVRRAQAARAWRRHRPRSPRGTRSRVLPLQFSAAQHVPVHVEHALSRRRPGVEHQPELAARLGIGDLLRDRHHLREHARESARRPRSRWPRGSPAPRARARAPWARCRETRPRCRSAPRSSAGMSPAAIRQKRQSVMTPAYCARADSTTCRARRRATRCPRGRQTRRASTCGPSNTDFRSCRRQRLHLGLRDASLGTDDEPRRLVGELPLQARPAAWRRPREAPVRAPPTATADSHLTHQLRRWSRAGRPRARWRGGSAWWPRPRATPTPCAPCPPWDPSTARSIAAAAHGTMRVAPSSVADSTACSSRPPLASAWTSVTGGSASRATSRSRWRDGRARRPAMTPAARRPRPSTRSMRVAHAAALDGGRVACLRALQQHDVAQRSRRRRQDR